MEGFSSLWRHFVRATAILEILDICISIQIQGWIQSAVQTHSSLANPSYSQFQLVHTFLFLNELGHV
jgi:hypothetical protein